MTRSTKLIILGAVLSIVSTEALPQASWEFKEDMAYFYRGPGDMAAASLGESNRSIIMKHAAKVSNNTVFFMKDGELYSASGVSDPWGTLHFE